MAGAAPGRAVALRRRLPIARGITQGARPAEAATEGCRRNTKPASELTPRRAGADEHRRECRGGAVKTARESSTELGGPALPSPGPSLRSLTERRGVRAGPPGSRRSRAAAGSGPGTPGLHPAGAGRAPAGTRTGGSCPQDERGVRGAPGVRSRPQRAGARAAPRGRRGAAESPWAPARPLLPRHGRPLRVRGLAQKAHAERFPQKRPC